MDEKAKTRQARATAVKRVGIIGLLAAITAGLTWGTISLNRRNSAKNKEILASADAILKNERYEIESMKRRFRAEPFNEKLALEIQAKTGMMPRFIYYNPEHSSSTRPPDEIEWIKIETNFPAQKGVPKGKVHKVKNPMGFKRIQFHDALVSKRSISPVRARKRNRPGRG